MKKASEAPVAYLHTCEKHGHQPSVSFELAVNPDWTDIPLYTVPAQAAQVNNKDLLNWIENEASRGLTEGDAREALTAIKWKIKDGR